MTKLTDYIEKEHPINGKFKELQKKVDETNLAMKEKIREFREKNPGVFIAIPKIEKTDLEYTCLNCGYTSKMIGVKITGYEDFEEIKKGILTKGRREYTTQNPSLICCENCRTFYEQELNLSKENSE